MSIMAIIMAATFLVAGRDSSLVLGSVIFRETIVGALSLLAGLMILKGRILGVLLAALAFGVAGVCKLLVGLNLEEIRMVLIGVFQSAIALILGFQWYQKKFGMPDFLK